MKVLLSLLLISYTTAEAPYAPRGFRPQGEPFTLPPNRFTQQSLTVSPIAKQQHQYEISKPQREYGAPPSPQGQYLPPLNNGQVAPVEPLRNQYNEQTSNLKPEDQYVPPRPFSGQHYFRPQNEFEPQTQYGLPAREQSLPQQTSALVRPFEAPQREYGAPDFKTEERQVISFNKQQNEFESHTHNYNPITEQNVTPQENFNDQKLIANQQRGKNVQHSRRPETESPRGQQNEAVNPDDVYTRRVVQRRRKQQRGDQNGNALEVSGSSNRHGQPASTYGVPTTAKSVYLTRKPTDVRELESTTKPNRRLRTTTVRGDENATEEENENVAGPNVSVATAVAGRYYILQPTGELQQLQSDNGEQNSEVDKSNIITANLFVQNPSPFRDPIYTFNAPLIRLNK